MPACHLCRAHAGEEKLGCDIVGKALRAPVRLIASNAGVEGDVIIEKLLGKDFQIGYNAVRDTLSCSHSACTCQVLTTKAANILPVLKLKLCSVRC